MTKCKILVLLMCALQLNISITNVASVHGQSLLQTVKIPTMQHHGPLTPIRLSFDPTNANKFAVVDAANGSVSLWSIAPEFRKDLQLEKRAVAVAISPNGAIIATSTVTGEIFLWDKNGNQINEPFLGHSGSIQDIVFSPDGLTLASAGYDHTVRLWSMTGVQQGENFNGHTAWVRSIAFSPDGKHLASASIDGTVIIWNQNGTIHAGPLKDHNKWVDSVNFSPNGELIASAGDDGFVRLWNLDGSLKVPPLAGHRAWVVAFSPCGKMLASTGDDGSVILRDYEGHLLSPPIAAHSGSIQALAFSPNCKFFITGGYYDGKIKLWNVDGTSLNFPLRAYEEWLRVLSFSKDGKRFAYASDDGSFRIQKLQKNSQPTQFIGHSTWVENISFSTAGEYIASSSYDGTVKVWYKDGTLLQTIQNQGLVASAINFMAKEKKLLIAYENGSYEVWQVNGKRLRRNQFSHNTAIVDIMRLPNSSVIITMSSAGIIKYWSASDDLLAEYSTEGKISTATISEDGHYIATGHESGVVKIWNTRTSALHCKYRKHDFKVQTLKFGSKTSMIFSTSNDGSIRVANTECVNLGKMLPAHNGPATAIMFNNTNNTIITGGYFDNTIKTWLFKNPKAKKTLY
ncbi:MAG: hypothetical protein CMM25_06035 [Rhodospirillaceae bacterium]|nr:hypothetical protein [Rhodospirillaceae bacterium]